MGQPESEHNTSTCFVNKGIIVMTLGEICRPHGGSCYLSTGQPRDRQAVNDGRVGRGLEQ